MQRNPNVAKIYVKLTDPKERPTNQLDLMARIRKDIIAKQSKELRIDVSEVDAFNSGQSTAAVQYGISGPDLNKLAEYSKVMVAKLKKVPGAVDVDTNLVLGKPEIDVAIDREKAASLGVQVADIAQTLQLLIGGLKVSTYAESGEDYDVRVRAERRFRADAEGLALVTVPSTIYGSVPLRAVVDLKSASGPATINRVNRQRQVGVQCNVAPGFGESDIQLALETVIADFHLPAVYWGAAAGADQGDGQGGQELRAGLLAVVHLHVLGFSCTV